MKNFLSATVNEFNLSFNRNISIIFHSEIGRNIENPFNMYEYSTLYNKFSEITPTNETMWINFTNAYYTITDKSILYRKTLKPYIIEENNTASLNLASTINNNNNDIVGIANVGMFFNYSTDDIKSILEIDKANLLVIDKITQKIIASKNNEYINDKIDTLYSEHTDIFNSTLEEVSIHNLEINNIEYKAYVSTIENLVNVVMIIPTSYFYSQIKNINNSIFYTILIAFLMAIVAIVFCIRLLFKSVTKISDAIGNSINNKDLTIDIPEISGGDEIGEMTKWVGFLNNSLQSILSNVKRSILISKKQSDILSEKINSNTEIISKINNNIEIIRNDINESKVQVEIIENNNKNIQEYIVSNTDNIDTIERETKELQNKIIEESINIEKIAAAVEEMSKTIESINNIISKAANKTKDLSTASIKSKEKMKATSIATNDLKNALGFISSFVSSIRNIAHQTNLLAMNAAIEAAHAGKYSSGFAVVAEEIRKLSEISNEQADNANKILQNIEEKIIIATDDLSESTEQFDLLTRDVQEVTEIMSTVYGSSDEQLAAINEIVGSITKISESSDHIKTQYVDMSNRLIAIRESLESLNNIAINASKTMSKLKEISDSIYSNVENISENSNELSISTNNINKFSSENNKILSKLETDVSVYKIKDVKIIKENSTQRVRGINLIILKEFIKTKFAEEGYQKWISAMEPSSSLIFKNEILSKEWYPYMTSFHKPYKLLCDLFYAGSNTGIKEISEYSFKQMVPKILKLLFFFIPKHIILGYTAEKVFKQLFDPAKLDIIKSRRKLLVLHLTNFNEDSEVIELAILVWASAMLESITHIRSSMEITKSIQDGENYAEFVLKW